MWVGTAFKREFQGGGAAGGRGRLQGYSVPSKHKNRSFIPPSRPQTTTQFVVDRQNQKAKAADKVVRA